jgi:hypothetical protein
MLKILSRLLHYFDVVHRKNDQKNYQKKLIRPEFACSSKESPPPSATLAAEVYAPDVNA